MAEHEKIKKFRVTPTVVAQVAKEENWHPFGHDPDGRATVAYGTLLQPGNTFKEDKSGSGFRKLNKEELQALNKFGMETSEGFMKRLSESNIFIDVAGSKTPVSSLLGPEDETPEKTTLGDTLLVQELEKRVKTLNNAFPEFNPNGHENDSILDTIYNAEKIVMNTDMKINEGLVSGNREQVAREMIDIIKSGGQVSRGLVGRRQRAVRRFLTPVGQEPQGQEIRGADFVPFDQFIQQESQQQAPPIGDQSSLLPNAEQDINQALQQPLTAQIDVNTLTDAQIDAMSEEEVDSLLNPPTPNPIDSISDAQIDAMSEEEVDALLAQQEPPAEALPGPIPNAVAPEESLQSGIIGPDLRPGLLTPGQASPTLSQPPSSPSQGLLGQIPSAAAEQAGTAQNLPQPGVAGLLQQGLSGRQVSEVDLNFRALNKGLSETIFAKGLKASGLPQDLPANVTNFEPEPGSDQEAITAVARFADPAVPAIFKAIGPATSVITKLVGPSKKLVKLLAKVTTRAEQMEFRGVSRTKIDPILRKVHTRLARATYRKVATNLGIGGGAVSLAGEASKQANEGKLNAKRLAGAAGTGFVAGAVLGVGGTAALRGSGKLANKVLRMFNKEPALLSGGNVDPQKVANALEAAESGAKSLVKRGIIEPKSFDTWRQNQFLIELDKRGVDFLGLRKVKESLSLKGGAFLNNIELANSIDKQFGTQLVGTFEKTIQARFKLPTVEAALLEEGFAPVLALEELGVNKHDATRLLQYVESVPGGTIFNPAAEQLTKTYFRKAFTGTPPSPQVMEQLSVLRKFYDKGILENPAFGRQVGYIKGYVGLIPKSGAATQASTVKGIVEPGFTKSRTATGFDENIFETDITKILPRYVQQLAKHRTFGPVVTDMGTELSKLQAMGRGKEADKIAEQFAASLGLKNKIDIKRMFGQQVADHNTDFAQAMGQLTNDPRGFADEFSNTLQKIMFDGTVFSSPTILVKQLIQPELVGTAELGAAQMVRGRKLALQKSERALALEHMDSMKSSDPNNFVELPVIRDTTNKALKAAEAVSGAFAKPIKVSFNKLDTENRIVAFLAGRDAFKRNGNAVLDNMLFGEKEMIKKVLREEGPEAASRMAGIIQSRRINFAYTIGDKPSAWAEGIGKFIPFTTWGRNQFSRMVGDLQSGNVKQLAKRVAIPYAQLLAFKTLTGYEIPNAHPLQAVKSILTADALPVIAESVEQVTSGHFPTAPFTRFASPIKMLKRASSVIEDRDKIKAAAGLKPVKSKSVAGRLRKAIQRGL